MRSQIDGQANSQANFKAETVTYSDVFLPKNMASPTNRSLNIGNIDETHCRNDDPHIDRQRYLPRGGDKRH
jgi:hypothetical protein